MPNGSRHAALAAITLLTALPAAAQPRWKELGKTGDGNAVLVDERSVKRAGDSVRATLRVHFIKPKKMPGGDVTASRTAVTFDCPKKTVAIRENTYFYDERTDRVFQHSKPKIPGFAPVLGGSMTSVAFDALCKR